MLLAISIEVQKKKKHDDKKSGKKTEKTFLAAEVEIEFKTRKETHTDKEKRYIAAICKLKKDISFFAI